MENDVVPHAGTWIEISFSSSLISCGVSVVPHAGTWIEISSFVRFSHSVEPSFPTRERGLKLVYILICCTGIAVVPHAGTWIEITRIPLRSQRPSVVPHAGTWIEICKWPVGRFGSPSFPTRERGLKLVCQCHDHGLHCVVPYVGMRIEITKRKSNSVVHWSLFKLLSEILSFPHGKVG